MIIKFPDGVTFPKRCAHCSRPAVNLGQTLCRVHDGQIVPGPADGSPTDTCTHCSAVLPFERMYATLCHECGNAHEAATADPADGDCDDGEEGDRWGE